MTEREDTVCFTGHRVIPSGWDAALRGAAERAIRAEILRGCSTFLVGGALGFDTLAQQVLIGLRREIPFIRILMAIPCGDQDRLWTEAQRAEYRRLLAAADERIVLQPAYTDGCMLARNRYMISLSRACIAFWNGNPRGGTAYTVRCAEKAGISLINIYPETENRLTR